MNYRATGIETRKSAGRLAYRPSYSMPIVAGSVFQAKKIFIDKLRKGNIQIVKSSIRIYKEEKDETKRKMDRR